MVQKVFDPRNKQQHKYYRHEAHEFFKQDQFQNDLQHCKNVQFQLELVPKAKHSVGNSVARLWLREEIAKIRNYA